VRFLTRLILRYPVAIIAASVAITIPCVYWTGKLYGNLRPDVEELLPRQSRSILDLDEIRRRLQSIDNLGVLVFTEDAAAGKRFTVDLATRLQTLPASVTSGVEYRIDRELRFFNQRKALFVDVEDLARIRDFIRDRIEYEKKLYNPLNIFSGVEIPEPQLDFPALLNKYGAKAASFDHFPDGFYATPDGKKRAVLVYLPTGNSGIAGVHRLKDEVVKAITELDPKKYHPSLRIEYTGGVQNTIEEYSALIEDIETSAEIVFAFVTLFLWLYFRSWLAVACLFFSLFMARFWTFGVSWFLVGYLNANSAFMGSLLLGSGITFGVMLLSRYLEERRNRHVPLRAARMAIHRTARATSSAALAAGLAYASLFLTSFEGFRQYGIIGFVGMVLCWVSSVIVCPAALVIVERWRPIVKPVKKEPSKIVFGPLARLIDRHPVPIAAFFVILTVASVVSFRRFDPNTIIETNLTNLRNKESMTKGSGYLSKHLDEIFQRFLSPSIILADSREDARKVTARLNEKRKREPEAAKLFASVSDISQFLPPDQEKKIAILKEIERELPPRIFRRLPEEEKERVRSFLTPEARRPFRQEDLPKLVLDKFTERDGSIGKLVLIEPPLNSAHWSGAELNAFVNDARAVGDEVAGKNAPSPLAGQMAVVSDMIEAITLDGPKATVFAFLAIVGLIVVFFRSLRIIVLLVAALVLGNLWLFGYILGTGFKINFLNFIAFPITFGIGIDYAVNVFHRYLHERDILKVIRETGGAVGLCSLTTITGYASLMIARNQAFVSFGTLAVIGEVTSLLAAVAALPAVLLLMDRGLSFRARSQRVAETLRNSSTP
jgi:hypothetical protein